MAAIAKPAIDAETTIRAIAQEWVKHTTSATLTSC